MEQCPHCYRPCSFPNVNAALRPEETDALKKRYDDALASAKAAGTDGDLLDYQAAVGNSEAVISRSFSELQRLSYSEDEVYATFYQRVDAGLRRSGGDAWDRIRSIADTALFGERNKRKIRFASLTLDGHGLPHYGDCSLVLREEMIAHRSTVFEENSVMFMEHHGVSADDGYAVPAGYRAAWGERGELAAAKAAGTLAGQLDASQYSDLLQHGGKDEKADHFVEVHIWGSLTIRSIERVSIRSWRHVAPSDAELQVVREKLALVDVVLDIP